VIRPGWQYLIRARRGATVGGAPVAEQVVVKRAFRPPGCSGGARREEKEGANWTVRAFSELSRRVVVAMFRLGDFYFCYLAVARARR